MQLNVHVRECAQVRTCLCNQYEAEHSLWCKQSSTCLFNSIQGRESSPKPECKLSMSHFYSLLGKCLLQQDTSSHNWAIRIAHPRCEMSELQAWLSINYFPCLSQALLNWKIPPPPFVSCCFVAAIVDAERGKRGQEAYTFNLTEWVCSAWVSFLDG